VRAGTAQQSAIDIEKNQGFFGGVLKHPDTS